MGHQAQKERNGAGGGASFTQDPHVLVPLALSLRDSGLSQVELKLAELVNPHPETSRVKVQAHSCIAQTRKCPGAVAASLKAKPLALCGLFPDH